MNGVGLFLFFLRLNYYVLLFFVFTSLYSLTRVDDAMLFFFFVVS
jgi:hypothetical protein